MTWEIGECRHVADSARDPANDVARRGDVGDYDSHPSRVVRLVALLIISAKQRMLPWQGPRIRIGPKEKIKFRVEGIRKYKCPACWSEIREGDPMIRCTIDPAHRIHRDCRELVQDKCPQCKGKLE